MTKILHEEIECCGRCPYFKIHALSADYCILLADDNYTGVENVEDTFGIKSNCPLPDIEEPEAKTDCLSCKKSWKKHISNPYSAVLRSSFYKLYCTTSNTVVASGFCCKFWEEKDD